MAGDQSMLIAELLESRLADIALAIDMPIAWPNIIFEPPDDVPYGRVYILPAQTIGQDFAGQLRTYQGIFQVNLVTPGEGGAAKPQSFASVMGGGFPAAPALVAGVLPVYINGPPQIRQPIQDRPTSAPNGSSGSITYTIPVSMQYRADY